MQTISQETKQETIKIIEDLKGISEEEKSQFIEMVNNGENPSDVLDKLERYLQEEIQDSIEEAGITIDQNDPEYQVAFKKMIGQIAAAETTYNKEMSAIEEEAQKIQDEAVTQIDNAKIKAIQDSLSQ